MARNGFGAQFINAFGPAAQRAQQQMQHEDRMQLKRQLQRVQLRQMRTAIEGQQQQIEQRDELFPGELTRQQQAIEQADEQLETFGLEQQRLRGQIDLFGRTMDDQARQPGLRNDLLEEQIRATGVQADLAEKRQGQDGMSPLEYERWKRLRMENKALEEQMNPPDFEPRQSIFGDQASTEGPVREARGFWARGLEPTGVTEGLNMLGKALGSIQFGESLPQEGRVAVQASVARAGQQVRKYRNAPIEQRAAQVPGLIQELNQMGQRLQSYSLNEEDEQLLRRISQRQQEALQLLPDVQNPNTPLGQAYRRIQQGIQENDTDMLNSGVQMFNALKGMGG